MANAGHPTRLARHLIGSVKGRAVDSAQRDSRAKQLIDGLAIQLRELAAGKAIPRHWKNYFLKAIVPLPGRAGPLGNLARTQRVAKLLADGKSTSEVANETGANIRTVQRIHARLRAAVAAQPLPEDVAHRQAIIEGIEESIAERVLHDLAQEDATRKRRPR